MHRKKQRVPLTISHRSGWRDYQAALKRTAANRKRHRRLFRAGCLLILTGLKARFGETAYPPTEIVTPAPTADPAHGLLDKSKLQPILASAQLMNSREDYFYITADDQQLCVNTSLDMNLQTYLYGKMNTAHARQIAMVVLDPDSGQVKAMVGYDKHDPAANTCLDNGIPAASVSKIVTAAAAIDTFDFSPETVFLFNGAKHTLYKRQLREKKNRYTNRITLKQSFAQSVNPVFGKLGTHHLGRENLEKYSLAFGFNQHFEFELPLVPAVSRFRTTLITGLSWPVASIAAPPSARCTGRSWRPPLPTPGKWSNRPSSIA